ncbi:hypothetical protein D3C72_1241300 [compost metagenome]
MTAHAVFPDIGRLFRDRAVPAFDRPLPVLRVDGVRPAKALIFFRSLARQRRPGRLLAQHPAIGAVGPQHAVHRIHRRTETVVADEDFLFRALAVLDIDDQHIDAIDGAIRDIARHIADFGGAHGAVGPADHGVGNDLLAGERTIQIGPARLKKRLADDFGNAAADHLLGTAAEPFQVAVIGEFINVITIDIPDQNGQGIGEPA